MTRARAFGPARTPTGTLTIRGATEHNPRDVDVDIPLERASISCRH